jgi:hypothetical protein
MSDFGNQHAACMHANSKKSAHAINAHNYQNGTAQSCFSQAKTWIFLLYHLP